MAKPNNFLKSATESSATDISSAVRAGMVSAREVCTDFIARIRAVDPGVRAWEYFNEEQALKNADLIDRKLAKSGSKGALAGVPIAVKDVFNTRDMPTTMGSDLWKGFTPGNDAR